MNRTMEQFEKTLLEQCSGELKLAQGDQSMVPVPAAALRDYIHAVQADREKSAGLRSRQPWITEHDDDE